MVTTRTFNRIPSDKTLEKSLRRRSRRSGPNRRSGSLCSGRESAPSLRTPCTENPPTSLGGHPGSKAVTSFALEIARLKSAFHRTALTPGEDLPKPAPDSQAKGRESTGTRGPVSIQPAKQGSFAVRLVVPDNRYTLETKRFQSSNSPQQQPSRGSERCLLPGNAVSIVLKSI